jgi:hypothetical protein
MAYLGLDSSRPISSRVLNLVGCTPGIIACRLLGDLAEFPGLVAPYVPARPSLASE